MLAGGCVAYSVTNAQHTVADPDTGDLVEGTSYHQTGRLVRAAAPSFRTGQGSLTEAEGGYRGRGGAAA